LKIKTKTAREIHDQTRIKEILRHDLDKMPVFSAKKFASVRVIRGQFLISSNLYSKKLTILENNIIDI
jgi:hypothetical protein